ncbi:MAG: glycosyltransferase family 4 protein [Fibrobacter sp.]|nr:glycosyltransferase family 4 protein [Fibrobacter sp.]
MKVLILANKPTGLYKFRGELLSALLASGHEVILSVPNGDFVKEMEQMGCKFIETPVSRHGVNPLTDLKLLARYRSIIRSVRPDIVFTYTIKPNVYGGYACQICGVPYVANVTGLGSAVENGGLLQKITLALYKTGLRKAQKVFFQNSENRDFMLRHNVVGPCSELIPGSGVNLKHFSPLPYPGEENVNFVFISRIMRQKGIDQYLEAAQYISKKYQNVKFHVCGYCEAEYQGKLDDLVKDGTIIYHGMVRDVREIQKLSHCTVHPTFYPEGLSNVLLESSACARPIITTDRSGCREVIDDGVNGFVVKQRDSQDLIEKIEKFLQLSWEDRKKMGEAGRLKVEKEFDRQIVVDAYLKEVGC